MITPMCTYARGHDCAYACIYISVHTQRSMCAYTCGHDRAYVHIHASADMMPLMCKKRVCIIELMCTCKCGCSRLSVHTYKLGKDRDIYYIYVCIHTRVVTIALVRTFMHMWHGRTYVHVHSRVDMIEHLCIYMHMCA